MDLYSQFKDKVIAVAGAGTGMGRAIAIAGSKVGANLIIGDINSENLEETASLVRENGVECAIVVGDASESSFGKEMVESGIEKFGRINYLCNSVGIQTYGTVETTDEEDWDKSLSVNLKSIFLVSKYVVPEIRKQGGGAVVNISSVQGLQCQKNVAAYAASKGGAIALSRAMAMDYAHENIRVNVICPGSVDTPMLRYGAAKHGPLEEVLKEWGNNHPIQRIGKAEEIAQTALFLMSDGAGFMLGYPVVVDGGLISGIF